MEPNSLSPQQIATGLGWPIDRITELLDGSQSLTEDMAEGLGLFFKMDPQFWRNLQVDYDRRLHTSLAAKHL